MACAHRVKGESHLIVKIGIRQFAAQTVIQDFNIILAKLCRFLDPYPCQLTFRELYRLDLLTLTIISHAAKDDLIAGQQRTH